MSRIQSNNSYSDTSYEKYNDALSLIVFELNTKFDELYDEYRTGVKRQYIFRNYFEEALGGILRAKQIVVVGDEHQLPPTPFFQKTTT